jgi:polar amino acid transport system permease protein
MELLRQQFFNLDVMAQAWPLILRGLGMTALLCLAVIPLGLMGGLAVAVASLSGRRLVRWMAKGFIDLFRALPPLVVLISSIPACPSQG